MLLKKETIMKKQIGIWLDLKEAFIIDANNENTNIQRIESEIDFSHFGGGARSKTPYGPMDNTSERKVLDRRTHQMNDYFDTILNQINQGDELVIFGPAEAKVGLKKRIASKKGNALTVRGIVTADSMTENQRVAFVRDFFNK